MKLSINKDEKKIFAGLEKRIEVAGRIVVWKCKRDGDAVFFCLFICDKLNLWENLVEKLLLKILKEKIDNDRRKARYEQEFKK